MKLKVCGLWDAGLIPHSWVDTHTVLNRLPKNFLLTHSQLWFWPHFWEKDLFYFPAGFFSLTQSRIILVVKIGFLCSWLSVFFWRKEKFFVRSSKPSCLVTHSSCLDHLIQAHWLPGPSLNAPGIWRVWLLNLSTRGMSPCFTHI